MFIILQTLLNSPKRIELGIGSEYRRNLENEIIKHNRYFGSFNLEESNYIKILQPNAFCFKLMFPSTPPEFGLIQEKRYDFVFFANGLSKNKGVEDVLRGFGYVSKIHPNVSILIIGSCDAYYRQQLDVIIDKNDIRNNVFFRDRYPQKNDMLKMVSRSKIAVLPGITALLNSTVRESMFMGIPVVLYENSITHLINKDKNCLLTAAMEDSFDLGVKMLYAYEHPQEMELMAQNAKQYAEMCFSKESVGKTLSAIIESVYGHFYRDDIISEGLLLD